MKRKKTFVVGAGASAEFGLPTGGQLVNKIERICKISADDFGRFESGDRIFWNAFSQFPRSDGESWKPAFLADVASNIRQNMGLAPSIDNFLDTHQAKEGWAEVGKLAIARTILESEASSELWFDTNNSYNRPRFAQLPENWLTELFRVLVAQKGEQEFCAALSSCRFITFNYDSVIEQFFHQAIKSYFNVTSAKADEICAETLNIVHVYGSLGPVTCTDATSFGNWKEPNYVARASTHLKTFTEGVAEPKEILKAKRWLKDTDVLCFLGFGFLPLNLQALGTEIYDGYSHKDVFGTIKGIPPANLEIAFNVLRNEWYDGDYFPMPFEDVGANELIWRNSLFLSEADLQSRSVN
nr:hypothetical protein [uncultured Ruegeria sp.]